MFNKHRLFAMDIEKDISDTDMEIIKSVIKSFSWFEPVEFCRTINDVLAHLHKERRIMIMCRMYELFNKFDGRIFEKHTKAPRVFARSIIATFEYQALPYIMSELNRLTIEDVRQKFTEQRSINLREQWQYTMLRRYRMQAANGNNVGTEIINWLPSSDEHLKNMFMVHNFSCEINHGIFINIPNPKIKCGYLLKSFNKVKYRTSSVFNGIELRSGITKGMIYNCRLPGHLSVYGEYGKVPFELGLNGISFPKHFDWRVVYAPKSSMAVDFPDHDESMIYAHAAADRAGNFLTIGLFSEYMKGHEGKRTRELFLVNQPEAYLDSCHIFDERDYRRQAQICADDASRWTSHEEVWMKANLAGGGFNRCIDKNINCAHTEEDVAILESGVGFTEDVFLKYTPQLSVYFNHEINGAFHNATEYSVREIREGEKMT